MLKRYILSLFFCCCFSSLLAHELAFSYSLAGDEDLQGEQLRGWQFNFLELAWGKNDYSDFAVSLYFTDLNYMFTADVRQAWLQFRINKSHKLQIGKDYYLFSAVESSGACCGPGGGFGGSGSLSLYNFQPYEADPAFMLKHIFQQESYSLQSYLAHNYAQNANLGFRFDKELKYLNLGGSLLLRSINEPEHLKEFWELDLVYHMGEKTKISQQVSQIYSEANLYYYGIISYQLSSNIKFLSAVTPYLGYDKSQQQYFVSGFRLEPITNSYAKLEWSKEIDSSAPAKLHLQLGYVF
ncbi:MAG: hypothetical protein R6U84_07195 [Candidatus Cloacimonadales bacterium]